MGITAKPTESVALTPNVSDGGRSPKKKRKLNKKGESKHSEVSMSPKKKSKTDGVLTEDKTDTSTSSWELQSEKLWLIKMPKDFDENQLNDVAPIINGTLQIKR